MCARRPAVLAGDSRNNVFAILQPRFRFAGWLLKAHST
jgi:hypothetical protein